MKLRCKQLIAKIILSRLLRTMTQQIQVVKLQKQKEKALERVYRGLNDRWAKKLIKRGGIKKILIVKVMSGVRFFAAFHRQSKYQFLGVWSSMRGVVDVLEKMRTSNQIKQLMLEFHGKIKSIQRRLWRLKHLREARVSIVSRKWDRLYQSLAVTAGRIGDDGMKKILVKINKIPPEIKEYIIH